MGMVSNRVHRIVMCVAALLWTIYMGRECLDEISNEHASMQIYYSSKCIAESSVNRM
jgi:hypothetical protein